MRTLFQTIKQQFLEGNDLVLVSVTASSGSTPRGAGSRMLVGKNGRISGTIGGGAVEYRAECMALDILEKKESCQHEFRLNHKDVENIGMICGGDVSRMRMRISTSKELIALLRTFRIDNHLTTALAILVNLLNSPSHYIYLRMSQ